jgi:hypothetical protein
VFVFFLVEQKQMQSRIGCFLLGKRKSKLIQEGGEVAKRGASLFLLLARSYQDDQIKKDEIGRVCSTRESEEKLWWENMKVKDC